MDKKQISFSVLFITVLQEAFILKCGWVKTTQAESPLRYKVNKKIMRTRKNYLTVMQDSIRSCLDLYKIFYFRINPHPSRWNMRDETKSFSKGEGLAPLSSGEGLGVRTKNKQ